MKTFRFKIIVFFIFIISQQSYCQLYNKEVKAKIKIDRTSEFVTFTATAENLNFSDYSLRYEFLVFKADQNNNTSKSSQGNRFFLQGNEKKILSSFTVNNNVDGKVTLVLLIYPLETDNEKQGAIGKDRLVVTSSENGILSIEGDKSSIKNTSVSADQDTSAKDGIFLEGLVIQKTLTKAGRDFYRYFYADYFNRQIKSSKNILIEEVPGQRRSTRISVKVDGQLVWQFFANPKKDYLKQMAQTALQRSIYYLQQLQKQKETITRY
ncbi:CsgE family curli-type amyloid fiber assembly protein [Lacinutrix salivirga]